jgi:branched-chain amino acid transport system substrate-binding protein
LAKLASTKLRLKDIAVLYINDDLGDGLRKTFVSSFSEFDGKVSAIETFEKEGSNFRPQIIKIINKKPEAIFLAGYGRALGILIKQIREIGYKGLLLGPLDYHTRRFFLLLVRQRRGLL